MSKYFSNLALSLACLTGVVGCGAPTTNQQSSTQDIVTDLPDNGVEGPAYLYWTVGLKIFRGKCTDGVYLQPGCTNPDIQAMNYNTFKSKLDNGLSQTIVDLTAEVAEIQAAISTIESEVSKTLKTIAQKRLELGATNAELDAAEAEANRVSAFVKEYKVQLIFINIQIAKASDPDYLVLRNLVAADLALYSSKLDALCKKMQELVARINQLGLTIGDLSSNLATLCTRLDNLRYELADVTGDLQDATDDFSVYTDTISKLESIIVHRVFSDDTLFRKNRKFIRRFDKIFAEQ